MKSASDDAPVSESPNTAAEFVPRSWRNRGRMSEGHRERLELRAAALGLADPAAAAAWSPQVLDIGFGFGESLLALAAARPRQRVLGVEVHPPGQLRAMDRLVEIGAENVRVLSADVTHLLPLLAPASLELVQAFHPDPWPKRRHAERRLISHRLLGRLVEVLAPGGMFHLVVDDDTYAAAAVAAAESLPLRVVEPPQAPETKYGRRAVAAGRTVHSLAWQRI